MNDTVYIVITEYGPGVDIEFIEMYADYSEAEKRGGMMKAISFSLRSNR